MLFPFSIEIKIPFTMENNTDSKIKATIEDIGRLLERHKRNNIEVQPSQVSFNTGLLDSYNDDDNEYFSDIEKGQIKIENKVIIAKFFLIRKFIHQILFGVLSYGILWYIYLNSKNQFDLIPILLRYQPILIIISIIWNWVSAYVKLRKLIIRIVTKIEANELWFPMPKR